MKQMMSEFDVQLSCRMSCPLRSVAATTVVLFAAIFCAGDAEAVDVLASAATGQPYGVAVVEIPIGVPQAGRDYPPLEVSDDDGRVLFQASNDSQVESRQASDRPLPLPGGGRLLNRVGDLVRELAGNGERATRTVARRVSFLFTGSQPLRVTLKDSQGTIGTYDIVPQGTVGLHADLMSQWWNGFTTFAESQIESADYPTFVETYLVAMLARRTGMPLPDWYTDTKQDDDQLLNTLKLIGGAEGIGDAVFRRAAAGSTSPSAPANLPLPAPPTWIPAEIAGDFSGVAVEPMAQRVPPECFYIRYGSFDNFLWFRDLSNEYGGDISRMLTLRGIKDNAMARIEDQLSMKMTQLARMLGGTVIEDQALIGRDLYLADGATIGVLIQSSNMFLLQTAVNSDRAKAAGSDSAITLKDVQIGDRTVTLLSTADHRIRSFMAVDGEYLFVANSRKLIERFLEVAQSGESLASTQSFRLARQLMPLEREDTIFAYFSPQMLQNLVSPASLIELRRRLRAKADITMVHLARRAAMLQSATTTDVSGIDELTSARFLPNSFGDRPDGSGAFSVGDQVVDTLRGVRGTFLPIADVEIDAVTAEEAAWYEAIASEYESRFATFDPIMVGVQREVLDEAAGIEKITMHAEIAPWDPGKYGKLAKQLGPPTQTSMQFSPDDIITVQAHVASALLGPPTHLFVGIKDSVPPDPEAFDGILRSYISLKQIPGYLGAWPQPGALDRLPLGLGRGQPVGPGMTRMIGGLYRYTDEQFSVLSFQPDILQSSLPFLAATQADDSAQIRIHVGDLKGSKLESWVNAQLYKRSRETSIAGANYLDMLARQLQLEPDEVLPIAQQILGASMQCTLGGTYQPSPLGDDHWVSTAWNGVSSPEIAPPGYTAPAMNWFRGADASVTQFDDRIIADAVIEMSRQ